MLATKHAVLRGWSAGDLNTFPKSRKRLSRKSSLAALWHDFVRTVAFDTREIYAGLMPTIDLKQRFWKPFSLRFCAAVRVSVLMEYNSFDSTRLL